MKGNFKIIVLVAFVFFAVFAVMVFAGLIKLGADKNATVPTGTVVLWGTVKSTVMNPLLVDFNEANKTFSVRYVQKYPETFDQDLLEAIASGTGPDMFFLPDSLAFSYSNKIYTIPYTSYPISTFKNTFASAGEVFTTSKGILAFPIIIDPLVMYYNRSMLDTNNIVYPPLYWDEFTKLVPIFTQKNVDKQIVSSAVALGQYSNVLNAKDIISALFMQAGSNIVSEKNGYYSTDFEQGGQGSQNGKSNLGPILSFYTSFADPLKENYSWNKSLPNSRDFFSSDKSAFYFGFASELQALISKNPNQNFAVTAVPQIKNANTKTTSARVTGVAASSFSKNLNTAFTAASLMATGNFAKQFADALGVAPARRDLLSTKPADSYFPVFYSSALFAKSWLDPSPQDSSAVFKSMIDKVLSNTSTPEESVREAGSRLNLLLR